MIIVNIVDLIALGIMILCLLVMAIVYIIARIETSLEDRQKKKQKRG